MNTLHNGYTITTNEDSHSALIYKGEVLVKCIAGDIAQDGSHNAIEKAKLIIDTPCNCHIHTLPNSDCYLCYPTITTTDIFAGAKFKTSSGIVWIIDEVENNLVRTSMEHGAKGNYRNSIKEVVDFLNKESAAKYTQS